MNKKPLIFILSIVWSFSSFSQNAAIANPGYWQQHVDYSMEIDMNVNSNTYQGKQSLIYTNNSPDVLDRVFYHLYFNAFQPGSDMDIRTRHIGDPDSRLANDLGAKKNPSHESKISKFQPHEIGFINISSLKQNGKDVSFQTVGTVLEVRLNSPIQPGEKVTFDMIFDAQVPIQTRRSGRNNKEGISLSMSQWYPKMAEYDFEGWHADSYIQREFHGVWGNFDVKITIDKSYVVGGSGYLQNPNEIGHGYETSEVMRTGSETLTWHFKAPNVHDFTWAADPDYVHDKVEVPNGPTLHFLYQNDPKIEKNWKELQPKTVELMNYFSKEIGPYPYKQYSVIQGGDGGMEYAMCTLISGNRDFASLFGVTAHEMAHSWFHGVIANNETKHPWMDEGFADYFDTKATDLIRNLNKENPFASTFSSYSEVVAKGIEQPMTTHSDRHNLNESYKNASYRKGSMFLVQLGYIIGQKYLKETIQQYYSNWTFKHPTPNDFIRVAETVSGIELDWYLMEWTQTTNTIDYAVEGVSTNGSQTVIALERIGEIPMPIDLTITYKNGHVNQFHIPLTMMRGVKPLSSEQQQIDSWSWANPNYSFILEDASRSIKTIVIDPKGLMADVNRDNNTYRVN